MSETPRTGKPGKETLLDGSVLDFRALAEAIPHLVWSAQPDGYRDYFNARLLEYLGRTLEEMQGWTWQEVLHPDDRAHVVAAWTKALAAGTEFALEYRIRRGRDGMFRWHEGRAAPARDAAGEIVRWFGTCTDIDERKHLENSYHRFAELTSDYVHRCIRTGAEPFRVQWIDGALNPISGYSITDVLENGCFLPLVHPDDRTRVDAYFRGLAPGDRKAIEFRIVTKDGSTRWVTEKSYCAAGQTAGELLLYGAVTDITELKIAQEQLKASEERFRSVMDLSPDIISILTSDGALAYNSPAALAIHGYTDEEMAGRNTFELIHPDDQARCLAFTDAYMNNRPHAHSVQYRYRNKDGSYVWMEATISNHLDNPHINGLVVISRDISERKRIENELVAAKEAAEAANRAKSAFLANMSHEIRTPITGIIGFAELLDDSALSAQQHRHLGIISESAESLLTLVNDILDLSKIEAGMLKIECREFDLREALQAVVGNQRPLATAKELTLDVNLSDRLPARLTGDPFRLKQVLLNLMGNAVKFTEQGGITLTVAVEADHDPTVLLRFDVADTGIGISPEAMSSIFKPFSQADSSMSRKFGGSGLGLAICTQLATLMDGEIWADSREGVGSTFHFRLPVMVSAASTQAVAAPSSELPPRWEGPPLRILLVEDYEASRVLFAEMLKPHGHRIEVANNGVEALDMCRRTDYDMILMDVQMPVMDGIEAVSQLRAREMTTGGHVPVIALTAHAMEKDRHKLLGKGFDGYLSKPTRTRDLFREMQRCLTR